MMTFDTDSIGVLLPTGTGATVHQEVSITGETPVTAVLSDPTGAWGVRRVDNGDIVVAADTALTVEGGDYYFEFQEVEDSLEYEYCVKFTNVGGVYYYQGRINRRGMLDTDTVGTLGYARKRLVDEGGYYDLVVDAENSNYADAGGNLWINRACAWLDMNSGTEYGSQRFYVALAAGDYMADITRCKRLHHVECVDSLGNRTPLEIVDYLYLRESYDELWANVTQGEPSCCAPDIYRHQQSSLTAFSDTADASSVLYNTNRLIVMPPADGDYTLVVFGDFKQTEMTADTSMNYWTAENLGLLLNVARMLIEEAHSNMEDAKAFERLAMRDLGRMDVQTIWREMGEVFEMPI